MRIKMLSNMANAECSASIGQEIDVSPEKGIDLIKNGFAVTVKAEPVETSMLKPSVETAGAVKPAAKKTGKAPAK